MVKEANDNTKLQPNEKTGDSVGFSIREKADDQVGFTIEAKEDSQVGFSIEAKDSDHKPDSTNNKPKLLLCEVCTGNVASNAKSCPHCGAPSPIVPSASSKNSTDQTSQQSADANELDGEQNCFELEQDLWRQLDNLLLKPSLLQLAAADTLIASNKLNRQLQKLAEWSADARRAKLGQSPEALASLPRSPSGNVPSRESFSSNNTRHETAFELFHFIESIFKESQSMVESGNTQKLYRLKNSPTTIEGLAYRIRVGADKLSKKPVGIVPNQTLITETPSEEEIEWEDIKMIVAWVIALIFIAWLKFS
jgi:hypothetical protein